MVERNDVKLANAVTAICATADDADDAKQRVIRLLQIPYYRGLCPELTADNVLAAVRFEIWPQVVLNRAVTAPRVGPEEAA